MAKINLVEIKTTKNATKHYVPFSHEEWIEITKIFPNSPRQISRILIKLSELLQQHGKIVLYNDLSVEISEESE